jgi:hypothetical protein
MDKARKLIPGCWKFAETLTGGLANSIKERKIPSMYKPKEKLCTSSTTISAPQRNLLGT